MGKNSHRVDSDEASARTLSRVRSGSVRSVPVRAHFSVAARSSHVPGVGLIVNALGVTKGIDEVRFRRFFWRGSRLLGCRLLDSQTRRLLHLSTLYTPHCKRTPRAIKVYERFIGKRHAR